MRVALIGQPNCGKSTLFNQVAGYKAETGNFSGTTVSFTESRVRVAGEVIELVDLPGTYTLEGGSPAEEQAARYLDSKDVDVIVKNIPSEQIVGPLPGRVYLVFQSDSDQRALNFGIDQFKSLPAGLSDAEMFQALQTPQ